jgi:tetratricopeptide (TPR) repeat protein
VNDAAAPAEAAETELASALREGVRAEAIEALAVRLGLRAGEGELGVGRALVRALVEARAATLRLSAVSVERPGPARPDDSRVIDGRASFLVRLTTGGDQASVDLERIEGLRTLLAVMRAGSLRQRRAAVLRIGELLALGTGGSADEARAATEALLRLRAIPVAYELWQVRSQLPGAEGRRARAEGERWDELCAKLLTSVRAFWDGADGEEPIAALHADERAQLLVRARDLGDELANHLTAVIEGSDGVSNREARAASIAALVHAGDARLLPALRTVLESGERDLLIPAARALAAIDDARVHPLLKAAYERTAAPEERLVLAGALGAADDRRGLGYVREALAAGDERLLSYALGALETLGGRDEVQVVLELLAHTDPQHVLAAVRTLGRIGDSRALSALGEVQRQAHSAALRAEVEDAFEAIRARMELLGEEAPPLAVATRAFDTAKRAALVKRKDPAIVRLRAWWSLWLGHAWLAIGARNRAVARLEAAAALRPDWPAPVVALAMHHARRRDNAQALASFRRALGIDRGAVEDNAGAARMLAHAFLRRAETVQRDGRADIARGLLEEALTLDLRMAPSDLRFALEQRLTALRTKAS